MGCGINLLRPVVIDCFKMFQFSSAVLSSGFAVRNSPDEGCARVLSPANKEEYKTGRREGSQVVITHTSSCGNFIYTV